MADFAIRNLSVLAYAHGFTLWHYNARSMRLGAVHRAGFFNPASDGLEVGDMVKVSAADGGSCLYVTQASEAAGVVVEVMASTRPGAALGAAA